MPVSIGEQIKKARQEQGLSQAKLAALSNIHEDTIANLETGRNGKQGPTLVIIQAIGTALNTKFELWD